MAAGREMRFAVAGGELAGHALGEAGPYLLMLHGFGSDRASWFLNQPDVAAYAQTLALDLPGHGASTAPLADASAPAIAAQVAAALGGTGEPVHVVGHSFGGAVAIALAAGRPDLVASLTLVAPAGIGGRVNRDFIAEFSEMESVGDAMTALTRLVDRPRLISRQMAERVLADMRRPGRRAAIRAVGRALLDLPALIAPLVDTVARLPIRRAVIWGAADRVSPPEPDRIARLAAETVMVAAAGHLPHMERPAAVNAALRRAVLG
jgi:pyruvate dehydrogenase E2 component (dihydrolipoamide acetyltransferase)